jgi:site-specific DNA recombinase
MHLEPNGRAALYCRVSTDEQAREGHSLDAQIRLGRERTKREGQSVAAVYEEALSGAKTDRPEYQRMLAAAAAGEFETIYVWKFDRLGRDAEELLRAKRMLKAAGVQLVSLTEGSASEGTLIFGLNALVAEEEREKIRERTRAGLAENARSGRPPGGQPPLGYRAVGSRKERRLVIDPDGAATVRRIDELYLAGRGFNRIAATLNAEGHKTRHGARFSVRPVIEILENPVYAALTRWEGETFPGCWEPIRDAETWQKIRELRAARKATPSSGRGRRPKTHLLVGVLHCGRCGSRMLSRTNQPTKRRKTPYPYYICSRRHTYRDCDMPTFSAKQIDGPFLEEFEATVLDLDATRATIEERSAGAIEEARALAEAAEGQVAAAEAGLDRADRAFREGKISAENYQRLCDDTSSEIEAAHAEAERLQDRVSKVEAEVARLDADAELVKRLDALRAAVAGRIDGADDIDAIRAAIAATFELVGLHIVAEQPFLEPVLRRDAISEVEAYTDATGECIEVELPRKAPVHLGKQCEAPAASPPGRRGREARRLRTRAARSAGELRPRPAARPGRRAHG